VVRATPPALPIAHPPNRVSSTATDVNESGLVVGWTRGTDNVNRGFRWLEGGAIEELPLLTGATNCQAFGVNATGVIAGTCTGPGLSVRNSTGVVWDAGGPRSIPGTFTAEDINDSGQVTGAAARNFVNGGTFVGNAAYRTRLDGTVQTFNWLGVWAQPGGTGRAIGPDGTIVGSNTTVIQFACFPTFCDTDVPHAWWAGGTTGGGDLGVFFIPPNNLGTSNAASVNALGDIVGSGDFSVNNTVINIPLIWRHDNNHVRQAIVTTSNRAVDINDDRIVALTSALWKPGNTALTPVAAGAGFRSPSLMALANLDSHGYALVVGTAVNAASNQITAYRWYLPSP
jgi:hypothetical protein